MSSVSDHTQLLRSKEQPYEPVFEKMEWLYVNDVLTKYEASTSVIETGALSNSNRFVNYNKGYLSVPLVVTLTGDVENIDIAFKQSFLSMVNSITVDLNGVSLVQQNNLIDVVNHFQLVTTENLTTRPRWASIGFAPEFITRRDYLQGGESDITDTLEIAEISKLQQNNLTKEVAGTNGVKQYSVRAIIYLKDLHPIFQSIPISKALNFKIQIFWNCSTALANFSTTPKDTNVWRSYNGSNPLQLLLVSSATAPETDVRASVYVGSMCYDADQNAITGNSVGNVGTQVQLWVPSVTMKPTIEQDYFATNSVKSVKYLDYYQFTIPDITAGDNFNKLVSNGIVNLKSVLIVPFTNDEKENEKVKMDGLPMKYGHFNNLQVIVGGSNVLANDLRYTHQTFAQEFLNSHGLNSNESPSLGSGLFSYDGWFRNPYYLIDVSRVPEELTMSYRSLQISGTNITKKKMSLCVFTFFERRYQLNCVTGELNKD